MQSSTRQLRYQLNAWRPRVCREPRQRQTMFKQCREQVAKADLLLLPLAKLTPAQLAAAVGLK